MADQMINVVLEFGAPHFEFFDFLVRREIDILFDAIDLVVENMILVEHLSEMIIRPLQTADDLTMLGKFPIDRMMKVHILAILDSFVDGLFDCREPAWKTSPPQKTETPGN